MLLFSMWWLGVRDDGKFFSVESLRGVAALAVAWFHVTAIHGDSWARSSGHYGWLGVDAFFVISGFVVPYSIARTFPNYTIRDLPNFVLRRATRLEPP